jgi:hypothetical protein
MDLKAFPSRPGGHVDIVAVGCNAATTQVPSLEYINIMNEGWAGIAVTNCYTPAITNQHYNEYTNQATIT